MNPLHRQSGCMFEQQTKFATRPEETKITALYSRLSMDDGSS